MACLGFLEKEEGCGGEELFIGSLLQKKVLMALLHDWAFVTAIVLPATSARGTALSAQSAHHQSIMNGN